MLHLLFPKFKDMERVIDLPQLKIGFLGWVKS